MGRYLVPGGDDVRDLAFPTRSDVFNYIVSAYERCYDWLGVQFASEVLIALASWHQNNFHDSDAIKRHLLFYWDKGWAKSTLLISLRDLVGDNRIAFISEVTDAALRGTVDTVDGTAEFRAPIIATRPFIAVDEWSALMDRKREDMGKTWLSVLANDEITVNHSSIGRLSRLRRNQAVEALDGRLEFHTSAVDPNRSDGFTIKTNVLAFAATYKDEYLPEEGIMDRFIIIRPDKDMNDPDAMRNVSKAGKLHKIKKVAKEADVRKCIQELNKMLARYDTEYKDKYITGIDDDLRYSVEKKIGKALNFREQSLVVSYVNALHFYRLTVNDEVITSRILEQYSSRRSAVRTKTDDLADLLKTGWFSVDEIMDRLTISRRTAQYAFKMIGVRKRVRTGEKSWCFEYSLMKD